MKKPTEAALAAFDAAFPDDERAVRKKMFGMPAGFVNGNMFLGVWDNGVVYRLPVERQLELGEAHDTLGPFEPGGRRWKDYVHADVASGSEVLAGWATEALDHTATLPPKPKKAKKSKK